MAITDRTRPGTARRRSQRGRWGAPRPAAAGAGQHPVAQPGLSPAPPAQPGLSPAPAQPAPPPLPAPEPPAPTHTALDRVSGGRLFLYDTRMALLLLNEARHRTLEGLLGVPREQANLVTVVGLGLLAHTMHDRVSRALHAPFSGTPADAVLPLTATREILYGVAGPASRRTPYFGGLVALAVVARLSGPSVRATAHAVRSAVHGTRVAFRHRYGVVRRTS